MGRPWWYDSYWQKRKPPKRRFRLLSRRGWVWVAVALLALLLTVSGTGFRPALVPWLSGFVSYMCGILTVAVFIRAVLSWFGAMRYSLPSMLLDDLCEPILRPLRRVVPLMGRFDFTPIVAIIILYLIPIIFDRVLALFVR